MSMIRDLAEKKAAAEQLYRALSAQNVYGMSVDDQIRSSARYRLATDALAKATADYNDAIASMSADELTSIVNAPVEKGK